MPLSCTQGTGDKRCYQGGQLFGHQALGWHSDGNAHAPEEERDSSMRGQLCGARESVRWSQLSPVAGRASSPTGCLRENTRDWQRESRIAHALRPGRGLGRRAPFTLEPPRSALFALARWRHDALQSIFVAQIACFSQPRRGPAAHRNGDGDRSDYRRTVGPRLRVRRGASGHTEAHWWSCRKRQAHGSSTAIGLVGNRRGQHRRCCSIGCHHRSWCSICGRLIRRTGMVHNLPEVCERHGRSR
jgi:hypothetical protein